MNGSGRGVTQLSDDHPVAYTVPDAARLMSIGERTLWRMIADREIDSVKIGRSRRVPRRAITAYLEAAA